MKTKACLAMILFAAVSAANASAQVPPVQIPKPVVRVPAPAVPAPPTGTPSLPAPSPTPSTPPPKAGTPKTGRNGGTPGYAPEGQSASAAKPGKPGGTPGLLVGVWSDDAKKSAGARLGAMHGIANRRPEEVTIKADSESITFVSSTQSGERAQRYLLNGTPTKVQTAGSEVEARVVIEDDKLIVETRTAGGQISRVKWFIQDGDLVREVVIGERSAKTVYKKRGG